MESSYLQVFEDFQRIYRRAPQVWVRSPGRINLLGEHVDYNGGTVLPAAIDRAVVLAAARRSDGQCRLWASNYGASCAVDGPPVRPLSEPFWANYLLGVLVAFGWPGGLDVAVGGDVPVGAGVSSSAAVGNAMAAAVNALFDLRRTPIELAQVVHQSENHFVGVPCGIMDMFAGMMGRRNAFLRLSCRTLTWEYVPFSGTEWMFVLCHSGIERGLKASEYSARRQACVEGLSILKQVHPSLDALAAAPLAWLEACRERLDPVVFRRCRYVLEEERRVAEASEALRRGDMEALGALMLQTHEGLRSDFEVSCYPLDFLVERAMAHSACVGARLMGAGFGGCTLHLVHQPQVDDFIDFMQSAYRHTFGKPLFAWKVALEEGVSAHAYPPHMSEGR